MLGPHKNPISFQVCLAGNMGCLCLVAMDSQSAPFSGAFYLKMWRSADLCFKSNWHDKFRAQCNPPSALVLKPETLNPEPKTLNSSFQLFVQSLQYNPYVLQLGALPNQVLSVPDLWAKCSKTKVLRMEASCYYDYYY